MIAHLEDRALVSVTGRDAVTWLEGLVTQTVHDIAVGALRHGALLSPQGRLLADFVIQRAETGLWLDVDAATAPDLVARLGLYRLRADVHVEIVPGAVHAVWGEGATTGTVDPRWPGLGLRLVGEAPQPPVNAGLADYVRHRRQAGIAEVAGDGLADRAYVTEANLDLLNGVDFHKGCYVGQETTSRMKRRNGVRSRILPIAPADGLNLAAGTELLFGDLRAGEVMAGADGAGLALLRLDRLGGLTTGDGRVILWSRPDWMPAEAVALPGAG
jgi:folate-binding protein YgfZ